MFIVLLLLLIYNYIDFLEFLHSLDRLSTAWLCFHGNKLKRSSLMTVLTTVDVKRRCVLNQQPYDASDPDDTDDTVDADDTFDADDADDIPLSKKRLRTSKKRLSIYFEFATVWLANGAGWSRCDRVNFNFR